MEVPLYFRKRERGCLLEQGFLLGLIWYSHEHTMHPNDYASFQSQNFTSA